MYEILRTTILLSVCGGVCWLVLRKIEHRIPRISRLLWVAVLLTGWFWIRPVIGIPWKTVPVEPAPVAVSPVKFEPALRATEIRPVMPPQTQLVMPPEEFKPAPIPTITPPPETATHSEPVSSASRAVAILFLVWIGGMVASVLFSLVRYLWILKRLAHAESADETLAGPWKSLLAEQGIDSSAIPILVSKNLGPALIRTIRGYRLVVPRDLWSELSESGRVGILRHELAHFRRHDVWKSFFVRILGLPHWFNPVAHYAAARFDEAAEQLCDREAFSRQREGIQEFARILLLLHENAPTHFVVRQSIFGRDLKRRVACLLQNSTETKVSLMKKTLLISGTLAMLLFTLVRFEFVPFTPFSRASLTPAEEMPQTPNEPPVPDRVEITVVDDNHEPMKDVLLKVRLNGDKKEFQTDANGKVVVDTKPYENVDRGWFVFTAYAKDRVTTQWSWLLNKEQPVVIPATFTIRLEPGFTIGGAVVDEQGQPVSGAKVVPSYDQLYRAGNMYENQNHAIPIWDGILTDDEGRWAAEGYSKTNGDIRIAVTHDDFLPQKEDRDTGAYLMSDILAGKVKTVLKRGFPVRGTIRDEQGNPIPGIKVVFDNPDIGNRPSAVRTTDALGRYEVLSWYRKPTQFSTLTPDWAPRYGEVDFNDDKYSDSQGATLDFTLKKGSPIRLKLETPDGEPIPNYWVCFHSGEDMMKRPYLADLFSPFPNPEGIWEWKNAPEEEMAFDVDEIGGYDRIYGVKMAPREEPYIVIPKSTTTLSGSVVDSETKKPLESFQLIRGMILTKSVPGYSDEYWNRENPATGRGGWYSLPFEYAPEPKEGEIRINAIRIEAVGYEPFQSKPIELNGQEQTLNVELVPSKTKPVRAVVLLPNGKPAVDAEVGLGGLSSIAVRTRNDHIDGNTGNAVVKTDENGRFEFPTPGVSYVILAAHPDGFAFAVQEEVESGTIQLTPWARIEGTAFEGDKPAANASLYGYFFMPDEIRAGVPRPLTYEAQAEVRTNAKGEFVLERFAPGVIGSFGFNDTSGGVSESTHVATRRGKTSMVRVMKKNVPDDTASPDIPIEPASPLPSIPQETTKSYIEGNINQSNCSIQLKRLQVAFSNYHLAEKVFPRPFTTDKQGKPLQSWRVAILPYLGEKELYDKIRKDEPWNSEYNKQFHALCPKALQCPCGLEIFPQMKEKGETTYSLVVGKTAYPVDKPFSLDRKDLSDGTANTLLFAERATPVCWMDPDGDIKQEDAEKGIGVSPTGIGTHHLIGNEYYAMSCFFHGTTHEFRKKLKTQSIQAMITPSGGEAVYLFDYEE